MSSLVITILVFASLVAACYFSKRRFGLLALGLAAGSLLSTMWATETSYIVSSLSIVPSGAVTSGLSILVVTVLPAIVLMFKGPKHKSMPIRAVSSVAFGLLGVTLTYASIQSVATTGGPDVLQPLFQYKNLIISAGMIMGVVDIMIGKSSEKSDKKHKH